MAHSYHLGIATAWTQTKSSLHGLFNLPEYDSQGLLYRPNADFSPAAKWQTGKRKMRAILSQAVIEMPQRDYSLREALAELNRRGRKCD